MVEIAAEVAIVQGCEESIIDGLAGCNDSSPFIDVGFAGEESVACNFEGFSSGLQTEIEQFQRVYVNGKLLSQCLHDTACVAGLTAYVLQFLLGVTNAALQLLHTACQCLSKIRLLLFFGQVVVHFGYIVECTNQFLHLVLCILRTCGCCSECTGSVNV